MRDELRRAIEHGEIVPHYQPIVDLQTRRIIGFEALARWHHPLHQCIAPAYFIGLAEEAGLISALSESLLCQACSAAVNWPADIQLAVNMSPTQLGDPKTPERFYQIADQATLPFNRLTFEVTEGAVVEDFDTARSILQNLKSSNARLALDDFGTGYSGLRHLQMLPFDSLKLDAAFVRNMTSHRESRKIVAAVIGLCQNLGIAAVAEGIEGESQLEMLRSLGYGSGQGWLFGRAVPEVEATRMLNLNLERAPTQSVANIAEQVALRLEALPIQCLWQLQALYQGAPVGLAFVDRELRYLAVNERLAEMHGLSVANFLGRPVAEVIPELIGQIEGRFRRALAGETVRDSMTQFRPKAHRQARVLQSSYQPVRDASGEVIGVSVAIVDVTGRADSGWIGTE